MADCAAIPGRRATSQNPALPSCGVLSSALYHGAVAAHQLGEGGLVAAQQEKVEEGPVGQAGGAALGRGGADSLNRVVAQYCGTVPRLACGASPHAA